MRADVGLWRSTRLERDAGHDYRPEATHLVWEAPLLVTCASCADAAAGVPEDAPRMHKRDLDPVLAGALARWQQTDVPLETPIASLVRWFDDIHAGFDALEDLGALGFQAGAIALLAREDGAAIAQTGLERAWRWRDDKLEQVTRDHAAITFERSDGEVEIRQQQRPAASFRPRNPEAGRRWWIRPVELRSGDVLVLASGVHATTLVTDYISDAVGETLRARPRVAGAQDVADRIGALAERVGEYANPGGGVEWNIHSRLALAVVWI